jgi:catechol 2,3-dioxygenase-like lactoylglutathione lyase family enzyme
MNRNVLVPIACAVVVIASLGASGGPPAPQSAPAKGDPHMRLGNFSVSLPVKDLAVSLAFYEKLGFKVIGGNRKNWAILQNETATIGLFQGMFEKPLLTFNPGWDRNSETLPDFDDVRDIQRAFVSRGVKLEVTADEATTGPASFVLYDPDGQQILIDQHVPKPAK